MNEILEVLKIALPITQTAISTVVGVLFGTLFLRKGVKIKEYEKVKAGHFEEVAKDLIDNGYMTHYDYYRFNNFLEIAKLADEHMSKKVSLDDIDINIKEKNSSENTNYDFDFDWFLRFFESASYISNKDMKFLWAKVLSGEIENPGSFSLRTIEVMRNMSSKEAKTFENLTQYILKDIDGALFFLFDDYDNTINEKHGLYGENFLLLGELGLISPIRLDSRIANLNDVNYCIYNKNIGLFLKSNTDDNIEIRYTNYTLSNIAIELISLFEYKSNDDYIIDLGKDMKRKFENEIKINAYYINNIVEREIVRGKVECTFDCDMGNDLLI